MKKIITTKLFLLLIIITISCNYKLIPLYRELPDPINFTNPLPGRYGVINIERYVNDVNRNVLIPVASAYYYGSGLVMTNWHVQFRSSKFKRFMQIKNSNYPDIIVPIDSVVYANKDIDLAFLEVEDSILDSITTDYPKMIFNNKFSLNDTLIAITSPGSTKFALTAVNLVVVDLDIYPRLDPDPRMEENEKIIVNSLVTHVISDHKELIGPGSSGGPVFNKSGHLVGLVWTGNDLSDGTREVWVTPTTGWLQPIKNSIMWARLSLSNVNK